jgi:hypothetical protein
VRRYGKVFEGRTVVTKDWEQGEGGEPTELLNRCRVSVFQDEIVLLQKQCEYTLGYLAIHLKMCRIVTLMLWA